MDHCYETSPTTIIKRKHITSQKHHKFKIKSKSTLKQYKRQRLQIKKIKLLLRELKTKCQLHEKVSSYIEDTFPTAMTEMFSRLKTRGRKSFSPALRAFALTLNFYSPKAYNFVRTEFGSSLPHATTLRSWYHEVKVDEGFTTESFKALKMKYEEYKRNGKRLFCSLMLDEMHIKKQVEWDGKHFHGLSSLGKDSTTNDPKLKAATQVLVMLVVAIDSNWKVPVAYFFHKGLSGRDKANIVIETLNRLSEIGKNTLIIILKYIM